LKIKILKAKYFFFNCEQTNMASGWESAGPGFEPRQLQAIFDLGLPKTAKYSQSYSVPLMIDFARRTLKKQMVLFTTLCGNKKG